MIRYLPAIAFIIFTVCVSFAFEAIDNVTFFGTSDQSLNLSWDPEPAATYYEVRLYHVERDDEGPAGSGRAEANSITFRLPRTGHFVARIRACNDDLDPPCSDWTASTDGDWRIEGRDLEKIWFYGHVATTGEIIINKDP